MLRAKYLFNQRVPMRDGVELSADVYFPEGDPPYDVILMRTPYDNSNPAPPFWLGKGYAIVKQDVRGRGDSDGVFMPFAQEKDDGHDTVKWVARQPWCKGQSAGMAGGSYGGYVQWHAAKNDDLPELKVICPCVMGSNRFRDGTYVNGIFAFQQFSWSALTHGKTMQWQIPARDEDVVRNLPIEDLDRVVGCHFPHMHEWLAHPTYDDFWREQSIEESYDKIAAPTLIVAGWYDKFAAGSFRNFMGVRKLGRESAREHCKILVGPWQHVTSPSSTILGCLDFGEGALLRPDVEAERWTARFLKGEDNGADQDAPVKMFVMGDNVWREEHEWPLARTDYRSLYLGSGGRANSRFGDGTLAPDVGAGADTDSYLYDPADPVPALGSLGSIEHAGPQDQRPVERRDDVLVYTSEALPEALEVTGPLDLELFVSSDAVDTDFFAKLCDVYPDGRSVNLTEGVMRTRFREGLDHEVMMEPGEVYALRMDLGVTSNVFKRGHRIRLEITSSCFPVYTRNLNTGEPAASAHRMRVAKQTIHHSINCPSRLILPVIPGGANPG